MHAFTILAALAATASAIPFVKRAGGPGPGAGNYPIVGTKLRVAVLQPWGNDYLASNYTVDPACTAAWIQQYQEQPSTELTFVTTNVTDAAGYTGVALNAPGYGLEVTDGGVRVEPGATMADFYLQHGYLWNTASPRGFYYCTADSPSLGQPGVGRVSLRVQTMGVPEGCFAAAFVAI